MWQPPPPAQAQTTLTGVEVLPGTSTCTKPGSGAVRIATAGGSSWPRWLRAWGTNQFGDLSTPPFFAVRITPITPATPVTPPRDTGKQELEGYEFSVGVARIGTVIMRSIGSMRSVVIDSRIRS